MLLIDTTSYPKAQVYPQRHGYQLRGTAPVSIVVHTTNNRRTTIFEEECRYLFKSADVSAHYLISKAGAIVQFLDSRIYQAWHAGRALAPYGNSQSIGIELHVSIGEAPTLPQREALTLLCRDLMRRYHIPLAHIDTHRAVALPSGRKSDPEGWPDMAFYSWRDRLALMRFRFVGPQIALSSNDLRAAHRAPADTGWHTYQTGDAIDVDDITAGMAHDAAGTGFVPLAVLEEVTG